MEAVCVLWNWKQTYIVNNSLYERATLQSQIDVTKQSQSPLKSSSMSSVDEKLASQLAIQIFLVLDINSAWLMPVAMQILSI